MDKEMKMILRNNIVKFIIGSILLVFCFIYLHNHPAEKSAIFSWFEVMVQKVQIFTAKLLKKDSELLKTRFDYEKTYDELVNLAENNKCLTPGEVQEIKDAYDTLTHESYEKLTENLPGYIRKANEYRTKVEKKCQ